MHVLAADAGAEVEFLEGRSCILRCRSVEDEGAMSARPAPDDSRFDGLTDQEIAACVIAERSLKAVAHAWDVKPRQGVVDAILTLQNGTRAAFEVTVLAAEGAMQTDGILTSTEHRWPSPGQWAWTIQVGSPRDLPRLRECYTKVARYCEAANAVRSDDLGRTPFAADADVRWLREQSQSKMFGHPEVAALSEDGTDRGATLVPRGRGGVTGSLSRLNDDLRAAFRTNTMERHFDKLAREETAERHLFIPLHWSALSFTVMDGLTLGNTLPEGRPPIPDTLTHLWLAPQFSRRVLLWTPLGWEQHNPYDKIGQKDATCT